MRLIVFLNSIFLLFLSSPSLAADAAPNLTKAQLSAVVMDQGQETSARIAAYKQLYSASDSAVARTICVWDPVGKSGPIFSVVIDRLTKIAQIGMNVELKAYTNEGILTEDLKAGQCDAALFTGLRARSFNNYTGTLDALGAVPDSKHMRLLMKAITSSKAADHMENGQYVVMGYAPLGAVYLFVNDRKISTLADVAGKRFAVLDYDQQQMKMVANIGAQPVPTSIANLGSKFNNRVVDILAAPLVAYNALELYKGIGASGGVSSYPLFHMTLQMVGRVDKFPREFAQLLREDFFAQYDEIEKQVDAQVGEFPDSIWIPVPEEKLPEYRSLMQSSRVKLRNEGYYDPDMLTLARKVRCKFAPTGSECTNPVE